MQKSIYSFVWKFSRRQQLYVLFVTIISFPVLYGTLELPKIIINDAISPTTDDPDAFPITLLGLELGQIGFLLTLCGAFLALVMINGAFKYHINVYRGRLGERMLRRLRYDLYQRVLRFRLPRFKRMSQGEIIPMITAEVEPLGGFVGDAYALPAFQGGTLLTYLIFIFAQDPILGAAAISLYPIQAYIIPKLQRHVNQLGKQRVRTVRILSDRIGETVSGVREIHSHGTVNYHQADFTRLLGRIYDIRFEIYRRKFFIKFLNNFLNQLTPFFFYSIGGYLVIQGSLSFGALVAVLAAYKDLSGPWRELLNFYQRSEDARIKYQQVVEQFQPADLQPDDQFAHDARPIDPLPGELVFANVTYAEPDGGVVLETLNLTLPTTANTAVVDAGNGGAEVLLMLASRLLIASSGRLRLGEHELADLPEVSLGRAVSYADSQPYLFTDSLRANLIYGLRQRPVIQPAYDAEASAALEQHITEARAAANSDLDPGADWVDYDVAGAAGPDDLDDRLVEVLEAVELAGDVYRMGLNGTIDPVAEAGLADRLLAAREAVRAHLDEHPTDQALVELFAEDRYNTSASVAENLLNGTPVGDALQADRLAGNDYVLSVLDKTGLSERFVEIGADVAETMIDIFRDLPPTHEFFEQFSFIGAEDLPEFEPLVARLRKDGAAALKGEGRLRLMSLPFKLIVSRHRLDLIDEAMQQRLLEARRVFRRDLPADLAGAIEFFDAARYNAAASLQDNILFGKVRYGQAGSQERVQQLLGAVIDRLDLHRAIIGVGLAQPVGVAGSRLSGPQASKLGLARALLKRPGLLVLNEATARLDAATETRVATTLLAQMSGRGLIWRVQRPALAAAGFDEVLVLRDGRVAERGTWEELTLRKGGVLAGLVASAG